jgi:hypothetical protein
MLKKLSVLFLLAVAFIIAPKSVVNAAKPPTQSGTTLSATKTAEGFFNHTVTFDWEVTKSASPSALELKAGDTATVEYTLQSTKTKTSDVMESGVKGQICVTNGGDKATQNLKIVDQVEYKTGAGQFQDLPGASQTIMPAQLAPGESHCYDYNFNFTPVNGAEYRNVAHVTITNHSGWLQGGTHCAANTLCPFGPDPKAGFSIPADAVLNEVDAESDLTDVMTCPTGFTCTPSAIGPWHLTGTQTINYSVEVKNVSGVCNTSYLLTNIATLIEATSKQSHADNATVTIDTGLCPIVDGGSCTRTIGYWKTHAGFGPQADQVSQYLPQWLGMGGGAKSMFVNTNVKANQVLSQNVYGKSSNGITKLYAQLLAAKLNGAAGASITSISAQVSAADAFLATHDWHDWSSLSLADQLTVMALQSLFDQYNNGLVGPNHCN